MAAQKILIMGESGTGKSTSIRNCNPETTGIVNPVGKPLPFKGHFDTLDAVTDAGKIVRWMKEQVRAGKKILIVDDFQYILSVPYMNRIKEGGWDKWNDFGANYFEIIEVCKDLPSDVTVYYMTHTETLENGVTTIKLIGKLLREKITIEGLFTIVLRTGVNEGKYYFYTQNSGKDTVKSPLGMFPAYAIENDLQYVDDKIRSYYEIGEHKSDEEMKKADEAVAADVPAPKPRSARGSKSSASTEQPKERKSRSQVQAENQEKVAEYMGECDKAIDKIAGDREEVPFDEATAATENVPKPALETPPRRTRSERKADEPVPDGTTNTDSRSVTLEKDTYFHVLTDNNYIMKHKGDTVDLIVGGETIMEEITKEEFGEGVKRIAQENNPVADATNPPEQGERKPRQRAARNIEPAANTAASEQVTPASDEPATTGRRRRTR